MKNKNDFEFRYTAPTASERREIESIRNSYMSNNKSQSKLDYLRKLDSKVRNIPTIISLVLGVIGILLFGFGLSMILEWQIFVWGVAVCVIGLIPALIAYPIYKFFTKYLRTKHTDEILKISDELLNDEK